MHARSMRILSQHIDQGLRRGLARRSRDCGLAVVPESAPRLIPSVRYVRRRQRCAAPYPGILRYSPIARLTRATAGMTQIVASRHRRGMFAIDANQTSPIATVTSSTH